MVVSRLFTFVFYSGCVFFNMRIFETNILLIVLVRHSSFISCVKTCPNFSQLYATSYFWCVNCVFLILFLTFFVQYGMYSVSALRPTSRPPSRPSSPSSSVSLAVSEEPNLLQSVWAISPQAKARALSANRASDQNKQLACMYNLTHILTEKEFSFTTGTDNLPAFIFKELLSNRKLPEVLSPSRSLSLFLFCFVSLSLSLSLLCFCYFCVEFNARF
jgi:hypothetical protein